MVFITAMESVYSAVRTDSIYKAYYVSSLKGYVFVLILVTAAIVMTVMIIRMMMMMTTGLFPACTKAVVGDQSTIGVICEINRLTPNDHYSGRTAQLTSKSCILFIYSTNMGTEYFKHGVYSPFFPLQNAVYFIILTYLVPVLFTFNIQCVPKFKKIIPAPKG